MFCVSLNLAVARIELIPEGSPYQTITMGKEVMVFMLSCEPTNSRHSVLEYPQYDVPHAQFLSEALKHSG